MRYRSILSALVLLLAATAASAQTRIVTGRVTDSLTNDPVTSGQVSVQGTLISATVADDGTFTIAVPTRDVVLNIRSIGFKRREIPVPASLNAVTASLARDYFQLEAIVVTGQATGVERRNLANSVATVTADQLTKTSTNSVEQALQGKMAGADINQNNGAPGGGNIVRMRGVSSIIGSFQPLYVVDGVIVSNAEIGRGTNMVQRAYTSQGLVPTTDNQDNAINRIADLNPNDIESLEVLKGAAASAIYGSKASNGVILITTKRGRTGAPQFSLTQRVGASKIANYYGTRCYTSAAEAGAVFGASGAAAWTNTCHDFEKELYGRTAYATETSGSVSGGSENTRYFASVLAKHDGGVSPRTYADKQSLRLNLDQHVSSKLTVALTGDIIHNGNDRGLFNNENNGSPSQSAMASMPSFIDFRGVCPDGSRVENPGKPCAGVVYPSTAPYAFSNPFQTTGQVTNRESVWRTIFTSRINWDLISSTQNTLRLTANGGGDVFTQKNQVVAPPDIQFEALDGKLGSSAIGFGQSQQFNVNVNAVYTMRTSSGMSATTQAGVQYETNDLDRDNTLTENLIGGQTNQGSGTFITVQQYRERIRDLGFFAQEEVLLFNERLLLTAGLRADKSSNNSDAKKLWYYPKGAVSYRLPVSGFLSELKARAAIGQSGNRPSYGQKFTNLNPANINGLPISTVSTTTAASDLRPERQTEIETGLDATLFNGRGNIELTAYQKDVKDLLLTRTLTPTAGFNTLIYNGVFTDASGAEQATKIRNRGLEVALNVLPIQTSSFQWNVRSTFFKNRCTVLSTPSTFRPISFFNFNQFGTTQIEKDSSCTQIFANDTLGRFGSGDNIRPDGTTGTIGEIVNRRIGDNAPDWRGSLSNEFTFGRLKLYAMVEHQHGGLITNFSRYTFDAIGNSSDQVVAKSGMPLKGSDRLNIADNKTALGSATWPATYTKLREVTVSFDLPTSFTRKIWSGARYIRMNLSGRNLITWSKYTRVGYDPEVQQVARSLAVEATWELWTYPAARTAFFTIDLGF